MDDDNHQDRDPPEPSTSTQQHNRSGSMSLGVSPAGDEDTSTNNATAPPPVNPDNAKVLDSEIGVSTLLNRLKQSVASAKVGPEFCCSFIRTSCTLLTFSPSRNSLFSWRNDQPWKSSMPTAWRSCAERQLRASGDRTSVMAPSYTPTKTSRRFTSVWQTMVRSLPSL